MISQERLAQIEWTPGLEGLNTEEKLYRLYDLYCQTGGAEQLSDIILNAERLGFGIAYNVLVQSGHFRKSSFLDYLQEISIRLAKKLGKEFAEGKRQENIVFTIRSFYSKRAMDIRDSLAAKLNGRETESLEAINEGTEGKPKEKIGKEDWPREGEDTAQEKAELCSTIIKLYIENMMGRNEEPPRLMALCYSRILYQMEMRLDWKRIEEAADKVIQKDKRKTFSEFEKMVIAFNTVQETKKTNAPLWALERMGCQDFLDLRTDSEQSICTCLETDLFWQPIYLQNLMQKADVPGEPLWKDVIYTEHYDAKRTSAWANAMHTAICIQLMDQIEADSELKYEVMRLDTPLKTLMKNGRNKHVTQDER